MAVGHDPDKPSGPDARTARQVAEQLAAGKQQNANARVLAAIPQAKRMSDIDAVYQNMRQDALMELGSGKKRTPAGCVQIPRLRERAGSPNEYRGLVGQRIRVAFAGIQVSRTHNAYGSALPDRFIGLVV